MIDARLRAHSRTLPVTQVTDWYSPNGATVTCKGNGIFGQESSGSATW